MEVQGWLKKIEEKIGGLWAAITAQTAVVNQSRNRFLLDTVLTDVSEDTVTPGNSKPLPVKIMSSLATSAVPALISTHKSPNDFTATFTSNVTITLAGHTVLTDSSQIVYIKQVLADDTSIIYFNGSDGVTMVYAANVITIYGAGTPFVAGDAYEIGINYQGKAYDLSLDVNKVIEQSPLWNRYTDIVVQIAGADIGAADGVWVDQGAEIDVRGYKTLAVGIDLTIENSVGANIQLLSLLESGGIEYPLQTGSDYQEVLGDANKTVLLKFNVEGAAYIIIQTMADDVDDGGGTEATINIEIAKEW